MSVDFLRRLPLFSSLSESDLNWLFEQAKPISIEAGQWLMEEGSAGDACYIVVEGEFEIIKRSDQHAIAIALREPGAVLGEMSLLDHAPRSASVRAVKDSRLLMIPQAAFDQLLSTSPSAAMAILHTVSARLRQDEGLLRQSEKMAALGTLSAGLAHELNNPAAAVRRSAAQLREAMDRWQDLTAELDARTTDPRQHEKFHSLGEDIARRAAASAKLDPLARSDYEGEMQTWLEERHVDEAWELAPTLVTGG
jgi:CRP-like cAMP-binding protein